MAPRRTSLKTLARQDKYARSQVEHVIYSNDITHIGKRSDATFFPKPLLVRPSNSPSCNFTRSGPSTIPDTQKVCHPPHRYEKTSRTALQPVSTESILPYTGTFERCSTAFLRYSDEFFQGHWIYRLCSFPFIATCQTHLFVTTRSELPWTSMRCYILPTERQW